MKVGVIGTGWGLRLIEELCVLDVVPHLIYGHKNRDKLERHNFTESVGKVFEQCDAVICAVPPHFNLEMVTKAALSNTNIFIHCKFSYSFCYFIPIALR